MVYKKVSTKDISKVDIIYLCIYIYIQILTFNKTTFQNGVQRMGNGMMARTTSAYLLSICPE